MKLSYVYKYLFSCFFLLNTVIGFSQEDIVKYEAGAKLSAFVYQGDLVPTPIGSYKTPRFGIGFFVTRAISKSVSVRGSIDIGSLHGNDDLYKRPDWRPLRSFEFETPLADISVNIIYTFKNKYRTKRKFYPYVFAGLGLAFLNVKKDTVGFTRNYIGWQDYVYSGLITDYAKKPLRLAGNFPVGFGVRYPISSNCILFSELAYRFLFNDYLDGFSKSADFTQGDHFSNFSVGFTYRFKKNSRTKYTKYSTEDSDKKN